MPRLQRQIRSIAQYLGEREREAHYRLKKFKQDREASATTGWRRTPVTSPLKRDEWPPSRPCS